MAIVDLDDIMNCPIDGERDVDLHAHLNQECRDWVFEEAARWGIPMGLYVNKLLAAAMGAREEEED